jgi:hypothetical protein
VQEGSTLATDTGREGGRTIGGFQQGGHTILGERFIARDWQGFWGFYHLGFHYRALDIRSSPFRRSFRCHLIYSMHGMNWRREANFRKWFQSFNSSDLHHFTWDFTREVTKPRSIILVVLWSIWRHLGVRTIYLGFQASRGAHHILEEV